ncbi:restriction endonuclease subunit S [Catenibacterium mitsuokai]|uniref:restriction endonuclease subunit S n=1 Tax=Catenibacterium mitsuokai TaxID=100886 RepID=UPI0022DEC0E9|nr:restriction endonuclease subunit S [Catenibacterium mitsuokai]
MRVKLKDITKFSKGTQINGKNLIDDGAYSYLNGGINPSGKWNEFNVAENTVTISEGGNSSGYVNYMSKAFWCGAHCYYLYDGPKNSKYLYYALKSQQERLFRIRSGACMPNIKKSDLGNFIIEYEEDETRQEEVVKVLEKCELLIEDYNKKLALLDEAVRARFVEMFGDLRVNDKGWKYYKLDELTELITDGEHATPKRTTQGIYLLSARNVLNHQLSLEDVDYIDYDEFSRISRRIIPREGDVLISCSGSIGRCYVVPKNIKFQMVRSIALLRFKSNINPVFAEYMITSDYLQNQINKSKTASSQANLFQGKIKSLKGVVPPLELQNQFASFVQEIDKSRLLNICLKSLVESVLKIRIFSEYKKSS